MLDQIVKYYIGLTTVLLICNYCYDFKEIDIFLLDNYDPNFRIWENQREPS